MVSIEGRIVTWPGSRFGTSTGLGTPDASGNGLSSTRLDDSSALHVMCVTRTLGHVRVIRYAELSKAFMHMNGELGSCRIGLDSSMA
jgi:hypothetical protein